MKKIAIILTFLIIVISIGCGAEKVFYSSEDILDPYEKGQDVVIPDKPPEPVIEIEYTDNALWAKNLSEYMPIFENPMFYPQNGPQIIELPLEKGRVSIKAETYHKESSELIFTWFADNLDAYGLFINRNLPDGEDPIIFIPQDGSGSLQITDGYYSLKIEVTPIPEEPGWVKVTYDGSVLKR